MEIIPDEEEVTIDAIPLAVKSPCINKIKFVEEVVDAAQVSTAATIVTITTAEITLAQALEALKTLKPKVKGIVFQEPGECTTTRSTPTISSQQAHDKGKGIMIEEPREAMEKKDLIRLDEDLN
ncbi:hypothetical protein Tco_0907036 [Tanacetum coccineum]|uniref:Uncharacterized protein n=1 Tax=Tanacetum coccineum TaxID=301880 RepID=A0ABQ5CLM8_9ASTR